MAVRMGEDERRELVGHRVTLNGVPAAICGVRHDFPRVVQSGTGLGVEYAWATVKHIIETRNGEFRTS